MLLTDTWEDQQARDLEDVQEFLHAVDVQLASATQIIVQGTKNFQTPADGLSIKRHIAWFYRTGKIVLPSGESGSFSLTADVISRFSLAPYQEILSKTQPGQLSYAY